MSESSPALPSGNYVLDPVHSTFGFIVMHNGVSRYRGQFERVDVTLTDGVLSGVAHVDSFHTSIPVFQETMAGPELFNTAETPTVDYRSTAARAVDGGKVEIDGELTIRGITHSVTATGEIRVGEGMNGQAVGIDLEATLDRRDFNLTWQAPLPAGGVALGWEVTVQAYLELTPAG